MSTFDLAVLQDDLIQNPSARCACGVVVDTSGSMHGKPIEELNRGIGQFLAELQQDDFARYAVEIGLFSFGRDVAEAMPFTPAHQIGACAPFQAAGLTPMGEAVELALARLEARKAEYKAAGVSYYQPWLILMSDGEPTDYWKDAARKVREQAEQRKIVVIPVAVGDQANLDILAEFSPANRPPKRLAGLRFREFFEWLSRSMGRVSQSVPGGRVNLPSTDGWESI